MNVGMDDYVGVTACVLCARREDMNGDHISLATRLM